MAIDSVVSRAYAKKTLVPAFNIPHLPMIKPVCQAIKDENSVGLIEVARLEWMKFSAESMDAVAKEYEKHKITGHTFLHLDHVPVIDEDQKNVDYIEIIKQALKIGYQSVMVDGSRLDLDGNIEATRKVADLAHKAGVSCEAELGAVMGHESGERMPYEEVFQTKKGFTVPDEAKQFVEKSKCDWLSVAAGSIHGSIAEATRNQKKPEARLDIEHLKKLNEATGVPLVLHGGSGIKKESIQQAVSVGIAKMNIGTEIRQAYELELEKSQDLAKAQEAVYDKVRWILKEFLEISGNYSLLYE